DSESASLRLDVGCFDHLAPLLGLGGNELCKVAGRARKSSATELVSRALILESARLALISALSLSTISVDVFLGAPTPYHWLASKPGRNSPIVGMPGSVSERVALATASARSLPVLMC